MTTAEFPAAMLEMLRSIKDDGNSINYRKVYDDAMRLLEHQQTTMEKMRGALQKVKEYLSALDAVYTRDAGLSFNEQDIKGKDLIVLSDDADTAIDKVLALSSMERWTQDG